MERASPVSSGYYPTKHEAVSMIALFNRAAPIFQKLPHGLWLMSRLAGFFVPYTGSMRADIVELGLGYAAVRLPDRRRVRNQLRTIHGLALGNLGELTAALALMSLAPSEGRFIVTRLETEHLNQRTGSVLCRCQVPTDLVWATTERLAVTATIEDTSQIPVCRVTVYYKLG